MTVRETRVWERAPAFGDRVAIEDEDGRHSYAELDASSARVAAALLHGAPDLREARVAFLAPPGAGYVAALWGIWRAGGLAVPLALSHPPAELAYAVRDSGASIVVAHAEHAGKARPVAGDANCRFLTLEECLAAEPADALPTVAAERRAMMLYTSGTTGRPKGVVTTHANTEAQVQTLVQAWEWRESDRIVHALPLHHVHGIVNALLSALSAGASAVMLPRFDAARVWDLFARGDVTLFMGVPTMYARLAQHWDAQDAGERERLTAACANLRLMVSGSAALPVTMLAKWRALSGHVLLERYGMTEIGMALSNPLHGERVPGAVGRPLPGVGVRLVDDAGDAAPEGTPGEIEVRGPGVFLEYWGRPDATRDAFREGGWFRTGDVAVVQNGAYRILGRESTDILKIGGYKVSALEVEEALREHPDVKEAAVVGVPDEDFGQRACAAVVPEGNVEGDALREWLKERLAPYKVPRTIRVVDDLPRNAMGKVVKPELAKAFT